MSRLPSCGLIFGLCLLVSAPTEAADPKPVGGNALNLAFVLLRDARLPKGADVARAFAAFAPKDQSIRPLALKGEKGNEVLEFEMVPRGSAFVALMPVAVPKGEADDAARFSLSALGTGWKLPAHKAHLIVTVRDEGDAQTVAALSRFTSLLAAIAQASHAVGVYWGGAGATHDPKFFIETAREKDTGSRLMLWTGVSVGRGKDGRLNVLSLGMGQLRLPDLLLTAPKSAQAEAIEAFFVFLGYVAERGKPIPEGDTVGRSESERLRVHYVPSPVEDGKKVWRVDLK